MNTLAFLAGQQGLLILAVIVLMVGGKKLPELARGLGASIREFNKAKNSDDDLDESTPKKQLPPAQ
jgi:sec-independent protein translocase protein TatA